MREERSSTRSAQGTRLNKRGMESRRRFIDTAVETLAGEGPSGASANLIAKRAGVTWGTVQHQFGDADGVWAALVDELVETVGALELPATNGSRVTLRTRVTRLIELLWEGAATPAVRAVENLRLALPRDLEVLEETYPKTTESLRRLDAVWEEAWRRFFVDFDVSRTRLQRVQSLIPGAIRGLRMDADLVTFTDPDEGMKALAAGVIAYLDGD